MTREEYVKTALEEIKELSLNERFKAYTYLFNARLINDLDEVWKNEGISETLWEVYGVEA
jgi:hypothetical protein